MEKPEHISDEEKETIFNHYARRIADKLKEKAVTKKGPEDALKKGVGFTSKPSSGTIGKEEHPVEFKPGESNRDAIEKHN